MIQMIKGPEPEPTIVSISTEHSTDWTTDDIEVVVNKLLYLNQLTIQNQNFLNTFDYRSQI